MRYSDTEIYAALRHLMARGYAALTERERQIIDVLSAVC